MITLISEIAFLDTYQKWSLWYDDTTGQLDYLLFDSKELAESFKDFFNKKVQSLKTDDQKFLFYEKTKLIDFFTEWQQEMQLGKQD
jgi:hypothetical protein